MALRHADYTKDAPYMCRRRVGACLGLVCEEHEQRCVICDGYSKLATTVRICDECALTVASGDAGGGGRDGKCIVCNVKIAMKSAKPARYCQYCVALERDRDGCPHIMKISDRKMEAHLQRMGAATIN